VSHHDGTTGTSGILHEEAGAVPGLDLKGTALASGDMRQSNGGGSGGKGAKGKVEKSAAGGHGQAPLFRGARYAGLTRRQSQAAFSYMPASQNWQAFLASNSWAYFKATPRNGSMRFPARLKMLRSARHHARG
jgi:hypothetical protein